MVSVLQTSLSQNMLPETVALSPKVTITLYRTTSQCLTSYGCAITVLYVNIWYRICMELCLPLSSLNRLQLETNGINVLYIWSPLMLFRGSHHALVLQSELQVTSWDLASCCCNWPWCVWQRDMYFNIKFHLFLTVKVCMFCEDVRTRGVSPSQLRAPLCCCPAMAGHCLTVVRWAGLVATAVSPASNSSYLHLVICWQMLWME